MAWEPVIKETHWFGQYEYVDIQPGFVQRKINWSGNYIESTEIWRSSTGDGDLAHQPKTSFYSWLENELRFSVENPAAWKIRGTTNTAYNPKGFPDYDTDGECGGGGGQGLKNISGTEQNFNIHNLKAGDTYDVRYYVDGGNSESHITGTATGTTTVSIPANAVIRNVVITLAEYVASDFKVEEVSDVSDITSSYAQYRNMQTSEFGTLGYKYFFKGPGVLEDKRGAAPYITMKFGNDNDMTFVRALPEGSSSSSSSYQFLGTFHQLNSFTVLAKNRGGNIVTPEAQDANGNYYYTVSNTQQDDAGVPWDCQFWISNSELRNVPAGAKVKLHIRGHATDHAVNTVLQAQGPAATDYISYLDNVDFSTGWWTEIEKEFTVTEIMAGNFQYFTFNLNTDNQNNTFYFADIQIYVEDYTQGSGSQESETITYGAASIINENDELDPTDKHLQYPWTYKNNPDYSDPFNETEILDRFVGKEWSTFTAEEHPNHSANPNEGSWWTGGQENVGEEYVYGDRFNSIWPLCGNFFYFFPEVDGLLEIEYYCEGANESAAFWYKQKEDGSYAGYGDQPKTQFINTKAQDNWNTNGNNNYKLRVNVEKGGIYYLCSLPTNLHQQPIVRLRSYTFIPKFRVAPLYKVVKNTEVNTDETQNVAEIKGGPYNDLDGTNHGYGNYTYELTGDFIRNAGSEPRVKCLGNVASAKAKVEYNNGKQTLSFYDITFKPAPANPGGAVVAHVENGVGQASFVLTIAYDAADAKWNDDKTERVAATTNGEEVKSWDFYSSKDWDLGQYGEDDGTRYATNPDGWKAKSKLFKEVHKADGLTADWEFDYVDVPNQKEPIFKSIYDMEADNADMIHETAGLVFFTEPNELGIYNENDVSSTTSFKDRFIGLMGGGRLIIPFLKENDRVVIKMGCFGYADNNDTTQPATLTFTNAKDALGTAITGDYKIGGSGVKVKNGLESEGFDDLSKPYGEYHFISTGGDFTLQVKEADLLKIYSIAIYRNAANDNADILTENSVAAEDDKRYILNVPENDAKDHAYLHINYRGEDEPTKFHQESRKTGNITADDIQPDTGAPANDEWYNYSVNSAQDPANAKFGIFKVRLGVKTIGETYVTDYAECMIPVGYRQTMEYPYTWDFTDLKKYVSAGIDEDGVEKEVDEDDFKIWDEYGFRTNSEEYDGYIFAPGGQLYGGTTMFDETRGIGIFHNDVDNKTMTMNGSADAEDGGLAVSDEFGFIVPQVAAGQAVYVHAKPVGNTQSATFAIGSGEAKSFTYAKDGIFAMQMADNATTANVTLNFKGYEINKIAVSDIEKSVNDLGFASESRAEEIDPELMGYMTGTGLKAYTINEVEYGDTPGSIPHITLSAIEKGSVMGKATHQDHHAYIIYNTDAAVEGSKKVNAVGNGFHLFVPDMHDKTTDKTGTVDVSTNNLCSWLTGGKIDQTYGDYTVYLMNSKGYNEDTGNPVEGEEAFFRASNKASLGANKAYLQLLTTKVKPSNGSNAKSMFAIIFVDDEEGTETTSLNGVESTIRTYNDGFYYTLGGLKVQNPTKKGIYIKNGKKVVIK